MIRSLKDVSLKQLSAFLFRRLFRIKQRIPNRLTDSVDSINKSLLSFSSSLTYFIRAEEFSVFALSSQNKEEILNNAKDVIHNRLPILSKEPIELGETIKWDYDYLKGTTCKNVKDAISQGCDIKRVWELSRLHQLTLLCKAYVISGESEYIEKIRFTVADWINSNPCFQGPNWINPMEIAIRSCNIVNAIKLCPELECDQNWLGMVNQNLFWSGVYIRYHLENTTLVNNNHYISDLVGLIFLSLYYRNVKDIIVREETSSWLDFAYKELNHEVKTQILADGGSFEKSTSYHAYVLELLFVSSLLIKSNTHLNTKVLDETVKRMRTYILRFSHKNVIPFIGDSDNTRLFQFNDLYPYGNQKDYSVLFNALNQCYGVESKRSDHFDDSGQYFINSESIDVVVNCGRLYANAGHCHNDQLSYIIWYDDDQITEDSGTYCYTSDSNKRDLYRSTAQHSTVIVDGKEQNDFVKCFEIKEKTRATCVSYDGCSFSGAHRGYLTELGVIVNRTIKVSKGQVNVKDSVSKTAPALSKIIFSPKVRQSGENSFEINNKRFRIISDAEIFKVQDIKVSLAYGQLTKTIAVEMFFSKELNYGILFDEI